MQQSFKIVKVITKNGYRMSHSELETIVETFRISEEEGGTIFFPESSYVSFEIVEIEPPYEIQVSDNEGNLLTLDQHEIKSIIE